MRATAFTLIELLITISIVVILVGLLMAGAKAVRDSAVKSRTEVTVGMVANGLAAAVGERQTLPIVPHPLAGTKATRLNFGRGGIDPIRQEERHWAQRRALWPGQSAPGTPGIALDFTSSASVPTGGLMLLGGERVYFTSIGLARSRLLGNDVLRDTNVPVAYGAKRELLGMLGIFNSDIHDHVLAPAVHRGTGEDRDAVTRSISVSYANVGAVTASQPRLIVAPTRSPATAGWYTDQEEAVRRALESVWNELGKNQAIRRVTGGSSQLGGRYRFDSTLNSTSTAWRPGHLNSGGWRTVSLPGVSIIDGFGVELFISQAHDGRIRVISAGKDGCLRVNPGSNNAIDTITITRTFTTFIDGNESSRFNGLVGDDRDGTFDNISVGVEIDDYLDRITQYEHDNP